MQLAVSELIHEILTDAVRAEVETAVSTALQRSLPEVIRRASLPVYLTKRQLSELTGRSNRKIEHLKSQRRIPSVRRGRTVLFRTADIEAFLAEGLVSPKLAASGGNHDA